MSAKGKSQVNATVHLPSQSSALRVLKFDHLPQRESRLSADQRKSVDRLVEMIEANPDMLENLVDIAERITKATRRKMVIVTISDYIPNNVLFRDMTGSDDEADS